MELEPPMDVTDFEWNIEISIRVVLLWLLVLKYSDDLNPNTISGGKINYSTIYLLCCYFGLG